MSFNLRFACSYCSLVAVFMLFLQAASAQYNFENVDQLLTSKTKALGGKVVTLVSKDGKIIYKKEIGEDFKIETPAPIGAASKWLTAALIMTFVDKGEISLDDPVSTYLPVFTSYSKSYITIRQCLAEITGIETQPKKISRLLQKKNFGSLEEEVNHYASRKDISTNPGQEFFFGDIGYSTAGRVLEVVSKKKPFSRLMQERITRPLGMRKTTFVNEKGGAEDPSGGGTSTAGDMIKFMNMLLNNGEFNGKQILSKEAILEMEKVQFASLPVKNAPRVTQGFKYAYGAWVQESDKNGRSTIIASPGIYGTWPYIDRCRNYASVIFTRQLDDEQNPALYLSVKEEIEQHIQSECK